MTEWISVKKNGVPTPKRSGPHECGVMRCIVVVNESLWPVDPCDCVDSPEEREYVRTALFDGEQQIWSFEDETPINALLDTETLEGRRVTHWMPLPELPKMDEEK